MSLFCDLHTHTTASDGTYSPTELVDYAREKGLAALAVTDHETVEGVREALAYGRETGIKVIPGIELSTEEGGKIIHMVGLFVDPDSASLEEMMEWQQKRRRDRNKQLIQKLIDLGFDISFDDFPAIPKSLLSRTHIGDLLARRGYGENQGEVGEKYLNPGCPAYVRLEILPIEICLRGIRAAGGLAFIAHPNRISKDRERAEAICRSILRKGADGIETLYAEFDDDWRRRTETIARETGCLRSGGSDFHGRLKKGVDLAVGYGDLRVPISFVEAMEEVLA